MTMEHRQRNRKHLLFYLDVLDQHTQQLVGHLGDLSKGGLMIISSKPIPLHAIKEVRIKLPDLEELGKKFIDAKIETRWAKRDLNPDLHCIGCRFLHIDPDDLDLIDDVSELLGFNE